MNFRNLAKIHVLSLGAIFFDWHQRTKSQLKFQQLAKGVNQHLKINKSAVSNAMNDANPLLISGYLFTPRC